ncbi:MAG: hypothetical protein JXA82_19680 [Sedimentisphaerales bacterium]|nr:hypothetical protein [Sedimentisphaerales bacterium]
MRQLKCYKCGNTFDVPYEYTGHNVVCRHCDTLNPVPADNSKADSWFDTLRQNTDVFDKNFDRLFQALLEYERKAPAMQT